MKLTCMKLVRYSYIVALFILLSGCAGTIKSDNFHQLQTGSPLSEVSKKIFVIKEFSDARGTDRHYVGRGVGLYSLSMDQPVAKVITMAISKELERNGHKTLLYPVQENADFIIVGTIYKFSLSMKRIFNAGEYIGDVGVRISTISASDSSKILVRKYEGEYRLIRTIVPSPETCMEILEQALLKMIRDMSVDQELLVFLQQ